MRKNLYAVIETERLYLREMTENDFEALKKSVDRSRNHVALSMCI